MTSSQNSTSRRKDEHIKICLNENINYEKSNGLEKYEFLHDATTKVDINKIDLSTDFLRKNISFPIIISSMTGGSNKTSGINEKLAEAANELNIPMGVGSQRTSIESRDKANSFKIIRKIAPNIPLMSNIGAAQIVEFNNSDPIKMIIDEIEADGLIIHLNPLQELLQKEGEMDFDGLLKKISQINNQLSVPIIVKEVGSGISGNSAKLLLDAGAEIIDVAGSGGTSWARVELLRNPLSENNHFAEWGLRTSYCIREINELRSNYKFQLISSGGIEHFSDMAKSLALGADLVGSARKIIKTLDEKDVNGVIELIRSWTNGIKKIMFLTGSQTIKELKNEKLKRSELLY